MMLYCQDNFTNYCYIVFQRLSNNNILYLSRRTPVVKRVGQAINSNPTATESDFLQLKGHLKNSNAW